MNIQLGVVSLSARVHSWNELGLSCTTWVFGTCVFALPFWKIHFDLTVPSQASMSIIVNALSIDAPQIYTQIPCLGLVTDPAAWAVGVVTGSAFELPLIIALFLGASTPGAAEAVAAIWDTALLFGLPLVLGLAPQLYQTKTQRMSFLGGLLSTFIPGGLGIGKFVTTAIDSIITMLEQRGLNVIPWPDVKFMIWLGEAYAALMSILFFLEYCLS